MWPGTGAGPSARRAETVRFTRRDPAETRSAGRGSWPKGDLDLPEEGVGEAGPEDRTRAAGTHFARACGPRTRTPPSGPIRSRPLRGRQGRAGPGSWTRSGSLAGRETGAVSGRGLNPQGGRRRGSERHDGETGPSAPGPRGAARCFRLGPPPPAPPPPPPLFPPLPLAGAAAPLASLAAGGRGRKHTAAAADPDWPRGPDSRPEARRGGRGDGSPADRRGSFYRWGRRQLGGPLIAGPGAAGGVGRPERAPASPGPRGPRGPPRLGVEPRHPPPRRQ